MRAVKHFHYRTRNKMRISTHFHFTYGFTSEVSLSQDGAVGARLIQAYAHVRLGSGGAVKLLSSGCNLAPTPVGGNFLPEGGGFARDRTKPAELFAPLTAFFT
jgi:hypothetical protein